MGTLFPTLGFLNVYWFVFSYVADHFLYLPALGIIVPLAAAAVRATEGRLPAAIRHLAAALLLAGLGLLTWRQAGYYRDNETLSRATLAHNPGCWLAHNNLGDALVLTGSERLDEAIQHFQTALRLKPDYPLSHYNLGNSYAKLPGRMPEAIAEYETALRLRPDYLQARVNLGNALASSGRKPEAIAQWESVLRVDPENIEALLNLGLTLGQMPGQRDEARALVEKALQLAPDNARARRLLDRLNTGTR